MVHGQDETIVLENMCLVLSFSAQIAVAKYMVLSQVRCFGPFTIQKTLTIYNETLNSHLALFEQQFELNASNYCKL